MLVRTDPFREFGRLAQQARYTVGVLTLRNSDRRPGQTQKIAITSADAGRGEITT